MSSFSAIFQTNLQFNVTRVSVVGASGQGVTIKGSKELDLAVFVKGTSVF